jgi:hypothetical protein
VFLGSVFLSERLNDAANHSQQPQVSVKILCSSSDVALHLASRGAKPVVTLPEIHMLKMLVGFGLLIAALGCGIAAYGVFSTPTQHSTSQSATAGQDERQDEEKTAIGPVWRWLNARERAINAISAVLLMIFTAALVGATSLLYKSGERTVKATGKVAAAAKESAEATAKVAAAAKASADVAIIAQRPWVSIKATVGQNGLYYNVNGANLDLVFQLNNTGNTPAITVRIMGSPRLDVEINERMRELERVCSEAKGQPPNPKMVGYTIFPHDPLTIPITYSFADKQTLKTITDKQHGLVFPVVIGCIDHFLTYGEPAHHQSRFVYTLDRLTPEGPRAIRAADGDVAANSLRLIPSFEAGSFQAD